MTKSPRDPASYAWPFTERLRELIGRRKFGSVRKFALAAGIPPKTLYAIFAGRPPAERTIARMLQTLNVSRDEFYHQNDK